MTLFGVHTGPQNTTMAALREVWRRADELGFDWVSIWDHFYAATDGSEAECFEGVACHAALACDTRRVRCGSLVYSVGYRHPAVLANAICTIDHLSGGRAELGLGAGWATFEYDAYGIPFPSAKIRLDQLEEAIVCVRGLLSGEPFDFEGRYFQFRQARCEPGPLQRRLPITIGGSGERRTLRIAAQHADSWNSPYITVEDFARKREVLHRHCEDVGRDPAEISCTVNLGLAFTEESLRVQYGKLAEFVGPSVLKGSDQEIVDRIGQYAEAGAAQINLVMRPPFDVELLERFASALGLSASDHAV